MERLDINTQGLRVYIGIITDTTLKRVTEQAILNMEVLLIYRVKPSYNTHHKNNYTGRKGLKVVNASDGPLAGRTYRM